MSEANPGSLLPGGTDLPKYSTDLSTTLPGRVLSHSSLNQSNVVSSAEYSKFIDWAADVEPTTAAAGWTFWIARTDARTEPLKLEATLYAYLKSGNSYARTAQGSPATVTIPPGETPCAGTDTWALVRLQLPLASAVHLNNSGEYLGVRVWNSGPKDLRVAYRRGGRLPRGSRDLGEEVVMMKRGRWIRTDTGMTLVELMVAMTLLLGLSTMIVMFVSNTVRVQIHNDDENRGLSDAKVILDRLAR